MNEVTRKEFTNTHLAIQELANSDLVSLIWNMEKYKACRRIAKTQYYLRLAYIEMQEARNEERDE